MATCWGYDNLGSAEPPRGELFIGIRISVIQSRQKNQIHMGSGIVGKLTAQAVNGSLR